MLKKNIRKKTLIPVLIAGFALFGILSYAGDLPEPEWVSDSDLVRGVEVALAQDPEVAASGVTVQAQNGIISLDGQVPNYRIWQRTQDLARQVPGFVRLNTSDLTIRSRPLSRYSDDAHIAAQVEKKLAVDVGIDPASFEVVSRDGVVTLTGEVRSAKLKRKAELLAYSTAKVITVNNLLEVS